MVVLDTNVLSALMEANCEPRVLRCLDQFAADSVWTTSINVFEIRAGLLAMPKGKRQAALLTEFEGVLQDVVGGRILEFDELAAQLSAELSARRRLAGRTIDMRDLFIAGIVQSRRAILVTRNVRDFEGNPFRIVDPWASA